MSLMQCFELVVEEEEEVMTETLWAIRQNEFGEVVQHHSNDH
jgi:hypothetical protein